jgi:hypothetical protein
VCSRASLTERRYKEIAAGSRNLVERVETRSAEEYRRLAYEDFVWIRRVNR